VLPARYELAGSGRGWVEMLLVFGTELECDHPSLFLVACTDTRASWPG
jgi:hypothetical protein